MVLEQCSLLSCSTYASSFPLRFPRTDAAQLTSPGPQGHRYLPPWISHTVLWRAPSQAPQEPRKDPVELVPNVELPSQWAVHFKCRHHPETASRRLDQPTATTVRGCLGPHLGGQGIAMRVFIFPNLSCDYWRLITLLNYISLIMSQVENTFIFKNFLPLHTCSFEVFLTMILPMEIKEISLLSVMHCKCLYSLSWRYFSSVLELLIFCVVRFISLFLLASGLSCFLNIL